MMKIAVMSDFHLGVKSGTPREGDSFDQAEEAIRRAIGAGAEIIVILGDIFDRSRPSLETWARAMRIFSIPKIAGQSGVRLVETVDKPEDSISPLAMQGVPVVAIFGNHERRARGEKNSVEALEAAGKLIHLNASSATFEADGRRITFHGLGYVPERDLPLTLKVWNPKPVEDSFNVLLLHQSIGDFVFSSEERPSLQLSDLPRGFDLYLNGHVHYRAEARVHGKPLLLPGSTERTQLSEIEATNPKGFYIVEIGESPSYRFIELESVRDFFYERITFNEAKPEDVYSRCRAKIRELLARHRKNTVKAPILKIRLEGTLANGVTKIDLDLMSIAEEFRDGGIIEISHERLLTKGLEERIAALRSLRESGASIEERGIHLLLEYAKQVPAASKLDIRELFELLAERKDEEEAMRRLEELIKTLSGGAAG